jgi:hypothetical protein
LELWTLLKGFLENGVSAYQYWNISLKKGGVSSWQHGKPAACWKKIRLPNSKRRW